MTSYKLHSWKEKSADISARDKLHKEHLGASKKAA